MPAEQKLRALEEILVEMPGVLVAYSGGADSAFLAETAHRTLPGRAVAVTADSPSLARRELAAATRLARERGWRHEVVRTLELDDESYASNPIDRCYFCKSNLFDRIAPLAEETGWTVLLGTNLDDLGDWRPGQRAATERGARHPLVEAGLTKAEIRELSHSLGLESADKAASPCLASRLAYGVRVTAEALARVERAEDALIARGYSVVRVRDLGGDRARVEVGPGEVARLLAEAEEVAGDLQRLGFSEVTIDERGYRRGALNEGMALAPSTEAT